MESQFKIDENGKLTMEYNGFEIKEYSVGEIMARHNVRPFFIFAQSNSGKTIIGANCATACVDQKYSQIIYITQSYNVSNNIYLRNNVLKQFVFNPNDFADDNDRKIEFVKFLNRLEHTLEEIGEDSLNYQEIIKKYITPTQQEIIKTAEIDYCQKIKADNPYMELLSNVFQDKHSEADAIFKSIYSQTNFYEFFNKMEGSQQQLMNLFSETQNLKVMYQNAEMSKSFAFAMWRNKIRDDYQAYKQIIQNKYKEFIIQIYKQLKQEAPDEIQIYMQNQVDYVANSPLKQKIQDICSAIQSEPRFCVIFDDVSELLGDMLQETKLKYKNRSIKAYTEQFMKFMINKGRHYGTFFVAVHATNVIPSAVRQLIGNFIIPPNTLDQFIKQTTSAGTDKPDIRTIASELGEYNKTHGTFYTLIYFQNPEESIDGNKYAFMQAEYNQKDTFNISAYRNNPYFYYLAQHQNDTQESLKDDSYDDYSSYSDDE